MEQRALLVSALVLGCVPAAGAGGYLAVRQMATPVATETSGLVAAGPEATAAAPAEGTVAEFSPTPDAAGTASVEPAAAAAPTPAATSDERSVDRPAAARATRASTASAPRASGPSRPVTPSVARSEPSAPVSSPVGATRPRPEPVTTTARTEDSTRDTWPSRDTQTQTTTDSWPSRDAGTSGPAPVEASLPNRSTSIEPSALPAPVRRMRSVSIPADAVIGIQLERGVSTTTARVEDPVRARVTRDLIAGGDVVIPAGAKLLGNVTLVEEGGRVKERARLGIRFHTLVLENGTEIKLPTETIFRDGESPAGRSAAKIGGAAVGGAILGAIMGGGKGAVIGAASGAGGGTGWAMAGDRQPAELRAGQSLTVRVSESVTTQIEN